MLGYRAPSKKAIKDSIMSGEPMGDERIVETSMFGAEYKGDGEYTVVGSDPERNRKWFAQLTFENGKVIKVK